jgi:hypothetical protein
MKKIFYISIGSLTLITVGMFGFAQKTLADVDSVQFDPENKIKNATKLPDKNPVDITTNTIQWALGFLGLVAVIMIIYGGVTWMTAAGNEERVKKAKQILTYAVIGLSIVLLAWIMVTFVFTTADTITS